MELAVEIPFAEIFHKKFYLILEEKIHEDEKALHRGVHSGCCDRAGFNGFGAGSDQAC
jgi:hypothetical protein